jgi:hypothetical protein
VGLAQLFVEARILTLQLLHLFRHKIALVRIPVKSIRVPA